MRTPFISNPAIATPAFLQFARTGIYPKPGPGEAPFPTIVLASARTNPRGVYPYQWNAQPEYQLASTLIGEGRRKHSLISIKAVAAFATAAIGHPAAINQHLPIGGPEALSWRAVVATTERVLGRQFEIVSLPPGSTIPGLPEPLGQMVGMMLTGREMDDAIIEMTELAQTFNVRQTALEEVLRQQFASAA